MSDNKVEWFTPVAILRQTQERIRRLEKYSHKPRIPIEKELTYFNSHKAKLSRTHDTLKTSLPWDPKRKKENSANLISIRKNIFDQEKDKLVSIVSSFEYGRPSRTFYDMSTEYRRHSFYKEVFSNRSNFTSNDKQDVIEYIKPIHD